MSFAYPSLLFLLLLIPAIFGMWYWARVARRKKLRRYGRLSNLEQLMPEASKYKPAIKITLRLLALAALIVAVARPRAGEKEEIESTRGIEVMICFDVSNSMNASSTDDINGIARIERAKYLLGNLIDKLSLHTASHHHRLRVGENVSRRNLHLDGSHAGHRYRHRH